MSNHLNFVRDRKLEPVRPAAIVKRVPFRPEVRVLFKPWVVTVLFVVVGGLCSFVYGYMAIQ